MPMSLRIHVDACTGDKANEHPREFVLDDDYYEIVEIEDRWYEPEAVYFKVRTTDGKGYILQFVPHLGLHKNSAPFIC